MKIPRRFASKIGGRCGCKRWQKPLRAVSTSPQRNRPASASEDLPICIFELHDSGLACFLVNDVPTGSLRGRRASSHSPCAMMANYERLAHNDAGCPPAVSPPDATLAHKFVHRPCSSRSSRRALVGFGDRFARRQDCRRSQASRCDFTDGEESLIARFNGRRRHSRGLGNKSSTSGICIVPFDSARHRDRRDALREHARLRLGGGNSSR